MTLMQLFNMYRISINLIYLSRYNTLFKFLLLVKRIQLQLQQCWAKQMQSRFHRVSDEEKQRWWLRNHLAFLIDNLQYYLQVIKYKYYREKYFSRLGNFGKWCHIRELLLNSVMIINFV